MKMSRWPGKHETGRSAESRQGKMPGLENAVETLKDANKKLFKRLLKIQPQVSILTAGRQKEGSHLRPV